MQSQPYVNPRTLATMSGVQLLAYGPPANQWSRFEVAEPGLVASFSSSGFANPLRAAVFRFIDRANWRYFSAPLFPITLPEDPS